MLPVPAVLVGSALVRRLQAGGYTNLLTPEIDRLDLTEPEAVADFFEAEKPEYVFLAAAKVGGIHANNTYPAEFIYLNLMIQNNVIHQAYLHGVKRLLFLGSSCIYPKWRRSRCARNTCSPACWSRPTSLMPSPRSPASRCAKPITASTEREFIAVMPTNLYGPGDNFHPENSHVLPALIRRFHEAKEAGLPEVVVWGSGTPMREFLYVDDMADGCVYLMNLPEPILREQLLSYPKPLFCQSRNRAGCHHPGTCQTIKEVVGYGGRISFDATKPDGTPRKLQNVSRMKGLGWQARINLPKGSSGPISGFWKKRECIGNNFAMKLWRQLA